MKKKALKGDALMVAVMNQIIEHPETWDQKQWHCGTSHCFFGHAQIMGGRKQNDINAFNDGKELLGLGNADADWLSRGHRTLPEIYQFVKTWIDRDADGYDCYGYNRDGYNRDGYDRDGEPMKIVPLAL